MLFLVACGSAPEARRGWYSMRWVEAPTHRKPIDTVPALQRIHFDKVASYQIGTAGFEKVKGKLREGDVIAYHMTSGESLKEVMKGQMQRFGYQMLDYGHLAILTSQPDPNTLHLFSSHSFKGPNTEEDVDTLKEHSFDVYRLNRWEQVDKERFDEFIVEAQKRAGNKIGYDFSGMLGLWNSNLKPDAPEEIGHDYICSTVVAASLYYAGADLKVSNRGGWLDLVSPRQVVTSHGRLINTPEVKLVVE